VLYVPLISFYLTWSP